MSTTSFNSCSLDVLTLVHEIAPTMADPFAIVDLFAGPGGLSEGFAAVRGEDGEPAFRICLSVEKERSAHATLQLRSFLRQFADEFPKEYVSFLRDGGEEPDWAGLYPIEWARAKEEVLCLTLGDAEAARIIDDRIDAIRDRHGDRVIVIGGPPCQAYSLVGRARNIGTADYLAENDHRHFLYSEYVRILRRLRPAAFVMENVKGMLSSSVGEKRIFEQVQQDLRNAAGPDSYRLLPLSPSRNNAQLFHEPQDFVVRAEEFGIPQARHRVIMVGIRNDLGRPISLDALPELRKTPAQAHVAHVISGMPRLRSGLSRRPDDGEEWADVVDAAALDLLQADHGPLEQDHRAAYRDSLARAHMYACAELPRSDRGPGGFPNTCSTELRDWLSDRSPNCLANHETRGHMEADLARYLFASAFAGATGRAPKADEFPEHLAPDHRNWKSGKFADRFRVQVADRPSSTITSHISKDGHYFIHPDPGQCRSLTVREAARLQTFPDNYFFKGNRTQQYVQVGNAVPPFLAYQIASSLLPTFISLLEFGTRAKISASHEHPPSSLPRAAVGT